MKQNRRGKLEASYNDFVSINSILLWLFLEIRNNHILISNSTAHSFAFLETKYNSFDRDFYFVSYSRFRLHM